MLQRFHFFNLSFSICMKEDQWDQIWQNFAYFCGFIQYLAIFRTYFRNVFAIGQTFIVVNGQILNK